MGVELRRHRQRRLPRHLPRHRQPVVRRRWCRNVLLRNRDGPVVRGRHGVVGHRRAAQGPRRGVRRSRQRRRPGDRLRGRRRHARRRARAAPVREPGPRQRLARREAGGRQEQSRGDRRAHHGHRRGRRTGRAPSMHRQVGSGGSFGASPLRAAHRPGRERARVVDVEVWWPTSGTRQRFADVEANQILRITESASDVARVPRVPLPLGR